MFSIGPAELVRMDAPHFFRRIHVFALAAAALFAAMSPSAQSPAPKSGQTAAPKYPALPSETPAELKPAVDSFDYVRRDVMIPMRDGVRLHTVILLPRGAKDAPILLTRTPYNANDLTTHAQSSHLGRILQGYDNASRTTSTFQIRRSRCRSAPVRFSGSDTTTA